MESLLSKIDTRIRYIRNNSDNAFINSRLNIIENKMQEFKDRKFTSQESVDYACEVIINIDIVRLKGVPGQTNMVYKKMQELSDFVAEIPAVYFNLEADTVEEAE